MKSILYCLILTWTGTVFVLAQPLDLDEAQASTVPIDQDVREEIDEEHREALEHMARFTLALEQIRRLHASSGEEISYEELINAAIQGMTSKLDRYSDYLEGDSLQELQEQTRGSFVGVGIVINRGREYVTVVSPIEGSPGWEAGLAAGDQIVEIDGEGARGASVQNVVQRLRGEPGSDVTMGIRRPSEGRVFEVTLTRAEIKTRSVEKSRMLTDTVGYVRLKSFGEDTAMLLRKELTRLKKKDATGVVLDLRGNPGGLLEAAVDVAGLFLPKDTLVVSTRGKEEERNRAYLTKMRPHRLEPELVLLVNQGSASASEVVSGALQDHQRAVLVGEQTFGKASVQSILPLPDGSALRLTTARYTTPNGREIHGVGIAPDVEVNLPMYRWIRLQEGLMQEKDGWKEDPQLLRAVEQLQGDGETE